MREFEIIRRYFNFDGGDDVAVGVGDDAAVVRLPTADSPLVVSTDTLVAGTHFFADVSPRLLAMKATAVSVSDLAAMGAQTRWLTVALTAAAGLDESWFIGFAAGLRESAADYNFAIVGGDLTRGETVSVTTTAMGLCLAAPVLRSGAQTGDDVWLSGYVGEAAYALSLLKGQATAPPDVLTKVRRKLECPRARTDLIAVLAEFATAAIDLSDGLLIGAQQLGEASGVCLALEESAVPIAPTLRDLPPATQQQFLFCGGDDYELLFTAPPTARPQLSANSTTTHIGTVHSASDGAPGTVVYNKDGTPVNFPTSGYEHHFT